MSVFLLDGDQHWRCPNCTVTEVTQGQPNRFHQCAGLKGMLAPLVADGTDCKVEAVERGDYVNGEQGLRYDGDGKAIMAVQTTRADGSTDCAVFPAVATIETGVS